MIFRLCKVKSYKRSYKMGKSGGKENEGGNGCLRFKTLVVTAFTLTMVIICIIIIMQYCYMVCRHMKYLLDRITKFFRL